MLPDPVIGTAMFPTGAPMLFVTVTVMRRAFTVKLTTLSAVIVKFFAAGVNVPAGAELSVARE